MSPRNREAANHYRGTTFYTFYNGWEAVCDRCDQVFNYETKQGVVAAMKWHIKDRHAVGVKTFPSSIPEEET